MLHIVAAASNQGVCFAQSFRLCSYYLREASLFEEIWYIADKYDAVQCVSSTEEQPEAKDYHQSEARYI